MTQSAEGYVQLPPDGTGKEVRTLQIAFLNQATGGVITALMQVVSVVDPVTGIPVNVRPDDGWREEVLRLLRATARGLEILTEHDLLEDQGATDGGDEAR